jgi:hypothetical protein
MRAAPKTVPGMAFENMDTMQTLETEGLTDRTELLNLQLLSPISSQEYEPLAKMDEKYGAQHSGEIKRLVKKPRSITPERVAAPPRYQHIRVQTEPPMMRCFYVGMAFAFMEKF